MKKLTLNSIQRSLRFNRSTRLLSFLVLTFIALLPINTLLYGAVITSTTTGGKWTATTTWVGGAVPTSSKDVVIAAGATVDIDGNAVCTNLTINSGGKLWASTAQQLRVYGATLVCDGILGDGDASVSQVELVTYGTSPQTLTISGVGTSINFWKISLHALNTTIIFDANTTVTYATTSIATEGSSSTYYGSTFTINPGKILTLLGNLSVTGSQSSVGVGATTVNVNGTLSIGGALNPMTASGKVFAVNVGSSGILKTYGPLKIAPIYSVQAPTITVASGGSITAYGLVDCSSPSVPCAITGAGTFTLAPGATMQLANGNGLEPTAGPIQTTTRNFNTTSNYTYVGTVAQVTGSDLPATVNNLTCNNPAGVTLSAATTVTDSLILTYGTLTNTPGLTFSNTGAIIRTAGSLSATPTFGTSLNLIYGGTITQTGTTASSTSVTLSAANPYIIVGATVTGSGIPTGTTVSNIIGTALTLSAAATASATVTLSFTFNTAQTTGVELPTTNVLSNLTINNASGVTLGAGTTVNGALKLTSGTLSTGANTLTLKSTISGTGTINTGSTGTLAFGGTSEQTLAASNLTSAAVNTLTVNAKAKLTTTGTITASALNILNDGTTSGTGTLKDVAGTLTATNANVSQFITGGRNWYLSSPVTGALGSIVLGTSTATTHPSYFTWYDESKGSPNGWTNQTSTLTPALGYIAVSSTSTPSTDGIITFNGTLNTGSVPVNLTYSSAPNYIGYNLVGNPFPAYLNIDNLKTNSNIQPSYWYRTYISGGYVFDSENLPSGLGTSLSGLQMTGKIPPLQAFWLQAKNAYSFSFSSADCDHQDNTNNKFRAPSTANASQQVLRLQVSNGINNDEAIIYSNVAASNTYDAYDTPKMSNNNASIPEIYTIVGNKNLVINGMNSIPSDTELPLGFTTGQSNTFTLKATEISNFDAYAKIILKDNLLNTQQELVAGSTYTFSSDAVNTTNRFSLIFKTTAVSTGLQATDGGNAVTVYRNANNQIVVNYTNGIVGQGTISVYNAVGQKLESKALLNSTTVLNETFMSGVYLVTVSANGKETTKKVVIN